MPQQPIVRFEQDEQGDWVAILACGHRQHMRHDPPFVTRPWALTPEGRAARIGCNLECRECPSAEPNLPRG
jgi:hypothetical protein